MPVGAKFWIKRFLTVLLGAFLIIGVAQMLKTRDLQYSLTQALTWGLASAAVFTAARLYHSRKGRHCAICKDTPETQLQGHGNADAN